MYTVSIDNKYDRLEETLLVDLPYQRLAYLTPIHYFCYDIGNLRRVQAKLRRLV